MKIKCGYCGNMIDDTNAKCPNCGAPNDGVVRTAKDQPLTVEDLKQWYNDRGLPPYETTRFFIGENYKGARAFGIYKDEETGNFVVYKNKDSGQRAIRYEGTDEAYAVNELYMRLKQEILNQKSNNINKGGKGGKNGKKNGELTPKGMAASIGGIVAFIAALAGIANFVEMAEKDEPKSGYYDYNGSAYYYSSKDYGYNDLSWFRYDATSGKFTFPTDLNTITEDLSKNKTAKKYFLGKKYDEGYPCADFSGTVWAEDIKAGFSPNEGYYSCEGTAYYHFKDMFDKSWFICEDGEWNRIGFRSLPEELRHTSEASGMFVSDKYSSSINADDFSGTVFFRDRELGNRTGSGYYSADSDTYYHLGDWYDSNWYYYGAGGWEEYDYDELPYELQHPSVAGDFYFTPEWDASVGFTDFEDTEYYSEYQEAQKASSSSSDDSSYNWDGGSWDSNSIDWSSDW